MAGVELPDWLRGVALLGQFGGQYLPVTTDESGQLYIVLTGSPDITIPGNVNVNDLNTLKQIQGTDGTVFRTAKLNANGEFIIVPRGASGNYLAVDASGFMTTIIKALGPGSTLTTIAADASGQLIMVPRGASGNYMNVDASGFLSAIMKGDKGGGSLANIAVDAAGQIIMVPRGQSGNYVVVDANGNMLARILGKTAGGLDRTVIVDNDGQIIMVPRGSTGNYLAVDASGFMSAILKGNFGGTLKTVAVDTDGRMIGLLADTLDSFGNMDMIGLAELAGRLGGLQRWDARGRLLWGISFDKGFRRQLVPTTYGSATAALDPDYFEAGGYSLKCYAADDTANYIVLNGTCVVGTNLRLGFECAFMPNVQYAIIDLIFLYYHGTAYKQVGVRWDTNANKLYYINSSAIWTEIPGGGFPVAVPYTFNHLKFAVDLSTNFYIRVMANDYSKDMSALASYSGSGSALNYLGIQIQVKAASATPCYVYLDDAVVTYSEP